MNKLFCLIIILGSLKLSAQELEIKFINEPPYNADTEINLNIFLTNNTDSIVTYLDSRGPAWYSFNERWELSIDFKFTELYAVNNKFDSQFTDSIIISLAPGERNLIRSKTIPLGDAGEYRLTYEQEQGPQLVKKANADSDSTYLKSQNITPYNISKLIVFDVEPNYDTIIDDFHNMTWEEWKDYRHVKLYSRKKHFDNMHAAMIYPEDVYALKVSCKGKTEKEIKSLGQLKNLRSLVLWNYELDYFPKELTELELFELTILAKEGVVVTFPHGFSKDTSIREMRAKLYGGVPEALIDLTKLIKLDLSDCQLDSLPNLSTLKDLETLTADNAQLNEFHDLGIENLTKLKDLNLSGNRGITDIRPFLQCANLEFLVMNRTGITEIPDEIENLKKLKKLAVSNKLMYVSDSIKKLSDMRYLSFGGNRKLTQIPDSIINMKKLLHLDVSSTKIEHLPEGIAELSLEKVMIYNCECHQGKDYKALRRRLGENFKE